jgi:hypothetical protein
VARHHFPTFRGLATRPSWKDGSDVSRAPCSWLAAKIADTITWQELMRGTIVTRELPICWDPCFRGALRQMHVNFWQLNIAHRYAKGLS